MSKKVNETVNEEKVYEGTVEENIGTVDEMEAHIKALEEESERLELLVAKKRKRNRNILIGVGAGVLGVLGGLYIAGKKAEKEREKELAEANGDPNGGLILYNSDGSVVSNGVFNADGTVNTF